MIGSLITTAALGREFFSVLYYHLWPLWLYHIFQHCLINGPFSEKLLNTEYVLRFSLQLLSEKVLILRIIERDVIINYIGPCVKYQLFLSDFNSETCHFSTFCKKPSNIKFLGNPSSGSRIIPCGRTNMTKLITAFCNFANAPESIM